MLSGNIVNIVRCPGMLVESCTVGTASLYRSILRYALALNKYWTLLVQSPRQSVSRVVSFVGKTRDEGTLLGLT